MVYSTSSSLRSIFSSLKHVFQSADFFAIILYGIAVWFANFLFLSNQPQLDALWIRLAESNRWIEFTVLPILALVSIWVYTGAHESSRRLTALVLVFLPSLFFLISVYSLLDWFRSTIATLVFVISLSCGTLVASRKRQKINYTISILTILLSWLVPLIIFSVFGESISAYLGSPFIILIFVGSLILTFSCVSALPVKLRLVMIIPLFGLIFHELQHPAQTMKLPGKPQQIVQDHTAFANWLVRRGDIGWYASHNRSYPVFIVSSEGGGGFASAHASGFLQSVQTKCPGFGQHVFALIGVSGGAVGNAEFHNLLNQESGLEGVPRSELSGSVALHHELAPWAPCDGVVAIDSTFASRDHLAPILGSMLFDEFVRRAFWLPSGQRSRSTELAVSFENGIARQPFLRHFWTFYPEVNRRLPNGLPALIQVATDMKTGHVYPFAPFSIGTSNGNQYFQDFKDQHENAVDISLASATVASASFPYMTPSMQFPYSRTDGSTEYRYLVDGGYADNSGSFTARMLNQSLRRNLGDTIRLNGSFYGDSFLKQLGDFAKPTDAAGTGEDCELIYNAKPLERVDWTNCRVHFSLTHILIKANEEESNSTDLKTNFFLDPIRSILSTRVGRSAQETSVLLQDICSLSECGLYYQSEEARSVLMNPILSTMLDGQLLVSVFTPSAVGLPLGWSMPQKGMDLLHDRILDVESLRDDGTIEWGPDDCLSCIARELIVLVLTEDRTE